MTSTIVALMLFDRKSVVALHLTGIRRGIKKSSCRPSQPAGVEPFSSLCCATATVWGDVRNAWLIGPIEVVQSHRLQQLGIVDADRCRAVRTDFGWGPRGAVAFIDRPQQQAVPVAGLKLYPVDGLATRCSQRVEPRRNGLSQCARPAVADRGSIKIGKPERPRCRQEGSTQGGQRLLMTGQHEDSAQPPRS